MFLCSSSYASSSLNVDIKYGIATTESTNASRIAIAEAYPRFNAFPLLKIYTLSV